MIIGILLFIGAFLIGGIPTGYIVVKILRRKDIRDFGSGNIGFSNVYRTEGLKLGAQVLIIDVLKSFLVTFFFARFLPNEYLFRFLLGITVITGNIFTPFLKFQGGKGVATALGVTLALNPYASLSALCAFLITVKLSRYISLGSLVAVSVYTLTSALFYVFADYDVFSLLFATLLFIAIVARHISNIKRLINGQENRIGSDKSQ
jgi:glycerol-3-phosphate acyltransferase PlsY